MPHSGHDVRAPGQPEKSSAAPSAGPQPAPAPRSVAGVRRRRDRTATIRPPVLTDGPCVRSRAGASPPFCGVPPLPGPDLGSAELFSIWQTVVCELLVDRCRVPRPFVADYLVCGTNTLRSQGLAEMSAFTSSSSVLRSSRLYRGLTFRHVVATACRTSTAAGMAVRLPFPRRPSRFDLALVSPTPAMTPSGSSSRGTGNDDGRSPGGMTTSSNGWS